MNYWEYVKEQWYDYYLGLKYLAPSLLLFGFLIPIVVAMIYSNWLVLGIGITWAIVSAIVIFVEHEKNSYNSWKECYDFNHKQTNNTEQTESSK